MHKITAFKFQTAYWVWLKFQDGLEGRLDLRRFLGQGFTAELLERDKFRTLKIEAGGGLAWFNGYDICPDYLHQLIEQELVDSHAVLASRQAPFSPS